MINDDRRNQLLKYIEREFIGPDPLDFEGSTQADGEEILSSDPPNTRYTAGVLYPRSVKNEEASLSTNEPSVQVDVNDLSNGGSEESEEGKKIGVVELLEESEEVINLSNSFQPSAISVTIAAKPDSKIYIEVEAAVYRKIIRHTENGKTLTEYHRIPMHWNNEAQTVVLPPRKGVMTKYQIPEVGSEGGLWLDVIKRHEDEATGTVIYTFTLENAKQKGAGTSLDEASYFQTGFKLKAEDRFEPLSDKPRVNYDDEDYQSNRLLYRKVKNHAIGHGCSAEWSGSEDRVTEIRTAIFPSFEIKPIVPSVIPGVSLYMLNMSDIGDFNETINELDKLCANYGEWIDRIERDSENLGGYKATAERHIMNCRSCLERMKRGAILLKNDEKARLAFQLMNRVMLLQQLHYNLPLREWQDNGNGGIVVSKLEKGMPDIRDMSTWHGDVNQYGKWRPFQLAFILMNIASMSDKNSDERNIVDLIWFPTGGGKTEAYLGLSAFTIFIRRLRSSSDSGTTIIMRYTLRLLTTQQYERASAMICACESIRRERPADLGDSRITIGLWVGGDSTPNKTAEAVAAFDSLKNGSKNENPFIMLKCPWCGAQMGQVQIKDRKIWEVRGYRKIRLPSRKFTVVFQCHNDECDFSKQDNILPLLVIDEEIYREPPTLVLGTVDKFAMLPYRPEAQRLFGRFPDKRKTPPELIIQDELHLISGPLGSMVGHYETMINELCVDRRGRKEIHPKVIASTATISRAKEQCNALFCCGKDKVVQFPPAGIDAGDSFFAKEDKNQNGRLYVGIMAPGSSSSAMTTIRLYAALLHGANAIKVDNVKERDPYWTNLGYFNSLRELGLAATFISADIDEYLHTIYKRRREDQKPDYKATRRYIWNSEELTSRIRSDKIPAILQSLGTPYPVIDGGKRPIDICLATNMVSVGVDLPRLGLMTVAGQPKTTAEYIQATSRVGRSSSAPGIIFTMYNPSKPRDKSHYEQFTNYNSKIYAHVEPTSVTPFSSPLRERALHAILIGLIRLTGDETNENPMLFPSGDEMKRLIGVIENRVSRIDPEELEHTQRHVNEILKKWKRMAPQKYHDFIGGNVVPLMYPAGSIPNIEWDGRGFSTPMSMRSVDSSCEVKVVWRYDIEEDE